MDNSKKILLWIKENLRQDKNIEDNKKENPYISVMMQYFPTNKIDLLEKNGINRKLTEDEFNEIQDFVFENNFEGYIQDLEEDEEQYVPNF